MGMLRQIKVEGWLMVDEDLWGLDRIEGAQWLKDLLLNDRIGLVSEDVGDEVGRFVITQVGEFEEIEEG